MSQLEEFKVIKYCCMFSGCNREYTTKINLKRHVLITHIDTRRFTCIQCNQSFSSKQNLTEHSYLHSGEKPYKCNKCNQSFRHLSSYSLHSKFHHVERRVQESEGQRFLERETQTNH